MLARVGPGTDASADKLMWDTAAEKVSSGWLAGPFSDDEMTRRHGELWLSARRFVIVQSGKYRQIDDFSEHVHNSTVWSDERIPLGGVDEIVVIIKTIVGAISERGVVSIGGVHGRLHGSWSASAARKLLGAGVRPQVSLQAAA